jgi:hypothetical protein
MKNLIRTIGMLLGASVTLAVAEDRVDIESIVIKSNKELPQILYIVPWKDTKANGRKEQTLVLHSLFGDLFDPVYDRLDDVSHQPDAGK